MPTAYKNKTVLELRQIAKKKKYTGYSKLTKDELIRMLQTTKPNCPKGKIKNPTSGRCIINPLIKKTKQDKNNLLKEMKKRGVKVEKISVEMDKAFEKASTKNLKQKIKKDRRLLIAEWEREKVKAKRIGKAIDIELRRLESIVETIRFTDSFKYKKQPRQSSKNATSDSEIEIIPKRFQDVVVNCNNKGFGNWSVKDEINSGQFGTAFTGCKTKDDCEYVIKRQPIGDLEAKINKKNNVKDVDSYYHEVKALIDLQGWKHAPKLYAAWTCKDYGYFVIEKLYSCYSIYEGETDRVIKDAEKRKINGDKVSVDDLNGITFEKKIVPIVQELFGKKWVHTDVHKGNILCRKNGDVVLIDYGRARKFKNKEDTDFAKDHPWLIGKNKNYTPEQMYNAQIKVMERGGIPGLFTDGEIVDYSSDNEYSNSMTLESSNSSYDDYTDLQSDDFYPDTITSKYNKYMYLNSDDFQNPLSSKN